MKGHYVSSKVFELNQEIDWRSSWTRRIDYQAEMRVVALIDFAPGS